MLLHAKMYEMGDEYHVEGVRILSGKNFTVACTTRWDTDEFPQAAHYAISTTLETDRGLRDTVCRIIAKNTDLLNKHAIEILLTEVDGIAMDIIKICAKDLSWTRTE